MLLPERSDCDRSGAHRLYAYHLRTHAHRSHTPDNTWRHDSKQASPLRYRAIDTGVAVVAPVCCSFNFSLNICRHTTHTHTQKRRPVCRSLCATCVLFSGAVVFATRARHICGLSCCCFVGRSGSRPDPHWTGS